MKAFFFVVIVIQLFSFHKINHQLIESTFSISKMKISSQTSKYRTQKQNMKLHHLLFSSLMLLLL